LDGRIGAEPTFSKSRQVVYDYGLFYVIMYVVVLAFVAYWLNWFYSAIKRIEKSLQEIEKRLESQIQKDAG